MNCIFCTDEILPGDTNYYMPQHKLATICNNHYHLSCWATYPNKNICPMCQEELSTYVIADFKDETSLKDDKKRKKFEYKMLAAVPLLAFVIYKTTSRK